MSKGKRGMDEEERELSFGTAFLMYLILSILIITPIVMLLVYFSNVFTDIDPSFYTKGTRMLIGFGLGLVTSVALSVVAGWRAALVPVKDEDEED